MQNAFILNQLNRIFFILFIAIPFFPIAQIVRKIASPSEHDPLIADEIHKASLPDTLKVSAQYNFMHLDLQEGLSSSVVRRVFIDSRNYIWIGTNGGGVSIYDGKKFSYLSTIDGLSHDIIWDIIEDADGKIWIGTDKGISIYDGKNFEYIGVEDGLGAPFVWSLCRDSKDRIWIGTAGGGFSIYDHGELSHHTTVMGDTTVQVYDIFEDSNGLMWLGTHDRGIITYDIDADIFRKYDFSKWGRGNIVTGIEETRENNESIIWASSYNGLFKLQDSSWTRYDVNNGLPHNLLFDLLVDHGKNLWIAGAGGLMRWNPNDPLVFTKAEGLEDPLVQSICEDSWGNLWIGFRNAGVSKYAGSRFVHYGKQTGIPGNVSGVFEDSDKNLWIGLSDNGILKYDGIRFLHYGPKQGFNWLEVSSIEEDDQGNLWFGCRHEGGVVKFDGITFTHYGATIKHFFNTSVQDMDFWNGELWLATQHSPVKIKGDSIYFFSNVQNIVDHYFMMDLFEDKQGGLWLGSHGGGVGRMQHDTTLLIKEEHGMSTNSIFSIAEDHHGNYWFVNNGKGLSILRAGFLKKPDSEWEWKYIGMAEGLVANSAQKVFVERDGDVWICTDRGLNKIVLNATDVFEDNYRIKTYGLNEGFVGIKSEDLPVEDAKGNIWFISNGNLSRFNPRMDNHSKLPPIPLITGIKIKLKDVDWSKMEDATYSRINGWNNLPSDLSLSYNSNHVLFEFNGISHDDPDRVEFSWRLTGFDQSWSPWSGMRNATYANLPPDHYCFELLSRDASGNVSEALKYDFEIRKAFWQTWWFRITIALLFLVLLYAVYAWRTMALRKRQKMLEQTVEERTEEIKKQKEEIEHQQGEIVDSITYAQRIQKAILPPESIVKSLLPDSFVIYRPKDIVAGDFYWVEKPDNEIYFAAADCTGHGVPGAMVSVVCSNALNTAVLQESLRDPGEILDRVRELVIAQFKKGNEKVKDGMDIALCRWNPKKNELVYAGAHNPLWLFSTSSGELKEIKADKQPVGQFDKAAAFQSHSLKVESGDTIYLFSDGFADQFGGPKGKKFKSSNLRDLMASLQSKSMPEQQQAIETAFERWKGDLEQLDDVCIIGVRL